MNHLNDNIMQFEIIPDPAAQLYSRLQQRAHSLQQEKKYENFLLHDETSFRLTLHDKTSCTEIVCFVRLFVCPICDFAREYLQDCINVRFYFLYTKTFL